MEGHRSKGTPRLLIGTLLLLLVGPALVTGCESKQAKALKARKTALQGQLGSLADQGDLDAMRLVADIEVLRAQGMFSDSLANALTAMPGASFLELDEKGKAGRIERGADITTLLEFGNVEQGLVKDGVISADEAAEVRRLATDNMAAAAEKAKQLRGRRSSGLP